MRIIAVADVHGDLESLSSLADYAVKQKPDLFLISGDFIDHVFKGKELEDYMAAYEPVKKQRNILLSLYAAKDAQEEIKNDLQDAGLYHRHELFERLMKDQQNKEDITDLNLLVNDSKVPIKLRNLLSEFCKAYDRYSKFFPIAEESMKRQYEAIDNILKDTKFYAVPGNHDGLCFNDVFAEQNIHMKVINDEGIIIAGYGSAYGFPVHIPRRLLEQFNEITIPAKDEVGNEYIQIISEPMQFLSGAEPDIVLTHEIPYENGVGSYGLRFFVDKANPDLLICGHYHNIVGLDRITTDSYIIHPGKIARLDDGISTFADIEINPDKDTGYVEKVTIHALDGSKSSVMHEFAIGMNGIATRSSNPGLSIRQL